jgi:hypothetical protein
MPLPKKIDDETLRDYVRLGFDQKYIAKACGVNESTINRRIKKLEKPAASRLPDTVRKLDTSLWDIKGSLELVHTRLLEELDKGEANLPVLAELRRTVETAHKILESLYTIKAQKEFEDAVLGVLNEYDPVIREKVLNRLRDAREVRAAFIPR